MPKNNAITNEHGWTQIASSTFCGYFQNYIRVHLCSSMVALSLPSPAYTVFGIFKDDALRGEEITNLIRAGKVLSFPHGLAFINQSLDFRVEHHRLRFAEDVED